MISICFRQILFRDQTCRLPLPNVWVPFVCRLRDSKHKCIPSGNLTQLWKITIFYGKIHYKLSFSIAMLNYQRVPNNTSRSFNNIWLSFFVATFTFLTSVLFVTSQQVAGCKSLYPGTAAKILNSNSLRHGSHVSDIMFNDWIPSGCPKRWHFWKDPKTPKMSSRSNSPRLPHWRNGPFFWTKSWHKFLGDYMGLYPLVI